MEELLALAADMSANAARDAAVVAAQRVVHGGGFASADPRTRARALVQAGASVPATRGTPRGPGSPFALLCRAVERRAALEEAAAQAAVRPRRGRT